jgi:flagellar biosynthesis anti-sigma factor FlgM
MASVREAAEVRRDRVAELKAAIAEGRYDLDADAIARRLLAAGLGELAT